VGPKAAKGEEGESKRERKTEAIRSEFTIKLKDLYVKNKMK